MALRTPISRVRSVTETSMMFITPTPPTIKANTRNREHEDENHAGDLIPYVGEGVLREDGEIIGLIGRNPAAAAQQFAHFVDRLGHVVVRGRLDADPILLQFGMQLAERAQREKDDVVVGILSAAEHTFADFRDTDHGEQLAFDVHLFAQRGSLGKSSSAVSWPSMMTELRRSSSISLNQRPESMARS